MEGAGHSLGTEDAVGHGTGTPKFPSERKELPSAAPKQLLQQMEMLSRRSLPSGLCAARKIQENPNMRGAGWE